MGYRGTNKKAEGNQLAGVRRMWAAIKSRQRQHANWALYRARRDRLIEAGLWDMPHIPPRDELIRLEAILDARQRRAGGMGSSDPSVD